MNIMKWNIFNDKGICFSFKESSREARMDEVGDVIIIIDNEYFNKVYDCIHEYIQYYFFDNKLIKKPSSEYWNTNILHYFKIILLEKYNSFPIYYIIDGYYQSVTFSNVYITLDKLNPLYIIFGKGKEYIGDMSDYMLLEKL